MPTENETAAVTPGAVAPPKPKKREDTIADPLASAPAPQAAAPQAAAPQAAAPATAANPLVAGFQQAFDAPAAPATAPQTAAPASAAPSAASAAVGPVAPPKKKEERPAA